MILQQAVLVSTQGRDYSTGYCMLQGQIKSRNIEDPMEEYSNRPAGSRICCWAHFSWTSMILTKGHYDHDALNAFAFQHSKT